jgi:Spx/MgsR family transcriptional regulator
MTTKMTRKARSTKPKKGAQFLHKSACPTCRKAQRILSRRGYRLHFRDIWREPLSPSELEKLIGRRDPMEFVNTRSTVYKQRKKESPLTRKEAIRLMSKEPSLIRRPIIVAGGRVVIGFDDQGRARL